MPEKVENVLQDLPLERIRIVANVVGAHMNVSVIQHFGNKAKAPVEAVYVFPLPDEACVTGVSMKIGEKSVEAELRKREDARKQYEEARDQGHHAALAEQERPNIFTMSVAGIEPGEEVDVETKYLAPVPWQGEGGRLVFPLVVAPRFIPGAPLDRKPDGGGWSPDTDEVTDASKITPKVVDAVNYYADLELRLSPGFAARMNSPSHGELIPPRNTAVGETTVIELKEIRCDRDIVVVYETESARPELSTFTSVFTDKNGVRESFTILQLTAAKYQMPTSPIDAVLLLDDSGSMRGAKCEGLKRIAKGLIKQLEKTERPTNVGVMMFDNSPTVLHNLSPITPEHTSCIDRIFGRGNTQLGRALNAALDMLRNCDKNHERCVVVVSDGQTMDTVHHDKSDIRIHAVGIDAALDDTTLKTLARETGGQFEAVLPGEDYAGLVNRVAAMISGPVIRKLEITGLPKEADVLGLGDLFAGRPLTVAIRQGTQIPTNFLMRGEDVDGTKYEWPVKAVNAQETDFGDKVWARMKLRGLNKDDDVTAVSLRYGIVARTTAFVGVLLKETPGQKPERVDISVLLPQTWDYNAVFGYSAGSSRAFARSGKVSCGFAAAVAAPRENFLSGPAVFTTRKEAVFQDLTLTDASNSPAIPDDLAGTVVPPPPSIPGVMETPVPFDEAAKADLFVLADKMQEEAKKNSAGETSQKTWKLLISAVENAELDNFAGWTETEKARLFLALATLEPFGFRMTRVPDELKVRPTKDEALELWKRAMRFKGYAV